jgi:hypothetical protein
MAWVACKSSEIYFPIVLFGSFSLISYVLWGAKRRLGNKAMSRLGSSAALVEINFSLKILLSMGFPFALCPEAEFELLLLS